MSGPSKRKVIAAEAKRDAAQRAREVEDFDVGDHVEIATRLLEDIDDDPARLVGDEGAIHHYRNGLWARVDDATQSQFIQNYSGVPVLGPKGQDAKPLKIRAPDVKGACKLALDRIRQVDFFADAPAGLAFSNGFTRVTSAEVKLCPHSPDNRARHGFSFEYKSDATSSAFLSYLDSLFRDDSDKAGKIACLQELLGISLLGHAVQYQKCAFLVGDGAEGKSTFLEIVQAQFPPGSVSSIPPQQFGDDYRRATLAGKLLNVVSELPSSDILASEAFKAIITGDQIDARQIYREPFQFRAKAGQIFALNRLPGTTDQSNGFWRRPIVIRFNRKFEGKDADRNIAARLLATERQAIVTWLLQGAQRLIASGQYTVPASHFEEIAKWRLEADQVALFFEAAVERLENTAEQKWITGDALYQDYRSWADANGHKSLSHVKFGQRAKQIIGEKKWPDARRLKAGWVYPVKRREQEPSRVRVAAEVEGLQSSATGVGRCILGAGEHAPAIRNETSGLGPKV